MKFKEGVIKPGMVIHCPTEKDARALLEHLCGLECNWADGSYIDARNDIKSVTGNYYFIEFGKFVTVGNDDDAKAAHAEIIESSDLVEPDDSLMSADKVLAWLKVHNKSEILKEIFECDFLDHVFDLFSEDEILRRINTYETGKTMETEIGHRCILYDEFRNIIENRELWGVSEQEAKDYASGWLDDYVIKGNGTYSVAIEYMERRKGVSR